MTTAREAGFPAQVWLGIEMGEWPIIVFDTEEKAREWSANMPPLGRTRYVYGPIPMILHATVRRAETVPATAAWVAEGPRERAVALDDEPADGPLERPHG